VNDAFTPEQLPLEYRRYADPSTICHGKIVDDCLRGDLSSDREVLVLGDSHAAMLNHFFDYLGKEIGFKARIITASSCVTIPGFDYQRIPEWAHQRCLDQIEVVSEYLPKAKIVFLAASWSWQLESNNFRNALAEFFKISTANETKVYTMAQEPLLDSKPLRLQRFNSLGFEVKSALDDDYKRKNRLLNEMTAKFSHVHYLDFNYLPMFKRAPFYNGKLMYQDDHHINEIGAIEYAKQAKKNLVMLLSDE
jgi:hypothetical protein